MEMEHDFARRKVSRKWRAFGRVEGRSVAVPGGIKERICLGMCMCGSARAYHRSVYDVVCVSDPCMAPCSF